VDGESDGNPRRDRTGRTGVKDARESGRVVLHDLRDNHGTRHLSAWAAPDGSIVIEGHDLGRGVGDAFGPGLTEYEWAWTITPDHVPAAVEALGGQGVDDILRLLEVWAANNVGRDPGTYVKDSGVPIAFWNRVGD
jgi:hypothetical protein